MVPRVADQIDQMELSVAERLSEKAKPAIRRALGRRAFKLAKLLIAVLLVKSGGLKCERTQPGGPQLDWTRLNGPIIYESRAANGLVQTKMTCPRCNP